jgi:autoinducer 2-degrading protein
MASVTFISRMTCRPEHEQQFVALCRDLEQYVARHEPQTLLFKFYRLREANRFAVLESFPGEAEEHAHMSSAKLAEIGPKIVACLDGSWVREYLDDLT